MMVRTSASRRVLHLTLLLALFGLAAACGSSGEGAGEADGSGSPVEDAELDAGEGDADDAELDIATDTRLEVNNSCVPGTRRCALDGSNAYEICDDFGEYIQVACGDDEVCERGECVVSVNCEPYEVERCLDCRTYEGCSPSGAAIGEYPVPFDRVCVEDEDGARLEESVCTPNSTRCADDTTVEACDECGTSYQFARDCFADDETTVCDLGQCISQCDFIEKRKTYIGCEYWAVDLDNAFVPAGGGNFIDADGKPFAVVVSNPSLDLTAEVSITKRSLVNGVEVDDVVATREVAPGALEVIPLHFYSSASDRTGIPLSDIQGTMIGYESFKVESTLPIVAYQFNPLDNETVYSNDASLLFPTSSLGTEYWVMTRRQTFDRLKGYLTVVAVLPGETEVTVTLPPRTLENPLETLAGVNVDDSAQQIPPLDGGESITFTLRQGQIFNLETNRPGADLTGSYVTSNRQIAVFGGAEAANAPSDDSCVFRESFDDWVCQATRLTFDPRPCVNDAGEPDIQLCSDYITCCADHIEHQMLPVNAWGRNFNATRSFPRGDEADTWRILAAEDGTSVQLLGLPDTWDFPDLIPSPSRREFTLDAGGWVDFQSAVDFEISASRPVMVGQFLAAEFAPYPRSNDINAPAHADAGTGDPAFILAVPVEQYRTDYTFLAPRGFELDYVTVTAPITAEVRFDGRVIDEEEWINFGRGDFRVARLVVEDGAHSITSDEPAGIMVHGYDSFVSYGFAGGLDLRDISAR